MDSINKQQPEENRKDLSGPEGAEKIKELVEKANMCFFCTDLKSGRPFATRPMSVQQVDDNGDIWFLRRWIATKTRNYKKTRMCSSCSREVITAIFSACMEQLRSAKTRKIEELWNPMIKTWFTEGIDDPRITVIKVEPMDGYYWDTKHGQMVAFVKTMIGAVMGKTLDDSIEGTVKP